MNGTTGAVEHIAYMVTGRLHRWRDLGFSGYRPSDGSIYV